MEKMEQKELEDYVDMEVIKELMVLEVSEVLEIQ
jgi:hypothetical protein